MQKEWQWCTDKYPKLKRDIGEKKSQQIWNLEEAAKGNLCGFILSAAAKNWVSGVTKSSSNQINFQNPFLPDMI